MVLKIKYLKLKLSALSIKPTFHTHDLKRYFDPFVIYSLSSAVNELA